MTNKVNVWVRQGFYDKFLAECSPATVKIGLSFFEAEELITDSYKDIQVDCITQIIFTNSNNNT
jgi:hypothetical protein